MNHYRYFLPGLFLVVSFAFAQRQADNLGGFTQVCLFLNVLTDGRLDLAEEAVLTHANSLAAEAGIEVRAAAECQSLTFDTTSDTLKILLTLQTSMLPEGGYAYTYTLLGLLDSLDRFSSASIYRLTDFGITSETEPDIVLRKRVREALSRFTRDWQSNLSEASEPTRETSERREGPTPNGGAYSIAYYRDESGNATMKNQARMVEIVEYNEQGKAIHSTIGYLSP